VIAGNNNSEFLVEAQFLSKLHTNNDGYFLLLFLLLEGTINEQAQVLNVTASYSPATPCGTFRP